MNLSSSFEVYRVRDSSFVHSVVFSDFSFFLVLDERSWRKMSSVDRLSNATSLYVAAAHPTQKRTPGPWYQLGVKRRCSFFLSVFERANRFHSGTMADMAWEYMCGLDDSRIYRG